jgi:hypothetical protein
MPTKTLPKNKTKVLLTLSIEQKKLISKTAKSKGLSLSAYLRLKALEEVSVSENLIVQNPIVNKIQNYLQKKPSIPKKYIEYKNFKDFHKKNYQN